MNSRVWQGFGVTQTLPGASKKIVMANGLCSKAEALAKTRTDRTQDEDETHEDDT